MAKEKRVTIRMTEEENERMKEAASGLGLPISVYIRKKVSEKDVVFRDSEAIALLRNIHSELRMINCAFTSSVGNDTCGWVRKTLRDVYGTLQRIESVLMDKKRGQHGYHKASSN